jgi:SAM-dependent methyltransferase
MSGAIVDEWDLGYFDKSVLRRVKPGPRPIAARLIAWERGREFYDGAREHGYGGFRYDGRWKPIVRRVVERYGLTAKSSVLEVGCKKGFFLHDLKELLPGIRVAGVENHAYAIETAMASVKADIALAEYDRLPYPDKSFDFVFAFSSIYMLHLGGVAEALREIVRVGRGASYVTLAAYHDEADRKLFEGWSLLGTTMLHVEDWREVFRRVGYAGDYYFTTARSLNLAWAE